MEIQFGCVFTHGCFSWAEDRVGGCDPSDCKALPWWGCDRVVGKAIKQTINTSAPKGNQSQGIDRREEEPINT